MKKWPRSWWKSSDEATRARLYCGDVLEVLRGFPSKSVHTIITSPPYWNLRDYETGVWVGGDKKCKHKSKPMRERRELVSGNGKGKGCLSWGERDASTKASVVCKKCGAKRINDRQLGSEKLHDCLGWARGENCAEKDWGSACYVCRMVLVFREVRRVLRDDGVLWLNMGDSYSGVHSSRWNTLEEYRTDGGSGKLKIGGVGEGPSRTGQGHKRDWGVAGGNLVGVPWRLALALQADGWILRQEIIWSKPAPMPESCTNRCTKAHEHIFLLTKKQSYFYDADSVRLEPAEASLVRIACPSGRGFSTGGAFHDHEDDEIVGQRIKTGPAMRPNGANLRSVWTIASEGSPVKHFATFPTELPRRCILAGTSERGCCPKCGSPWVRIVEKTSLKRDRPHEYVKRIGEEGTGNSCANTVAGVSSNTLGWRPNCKCYGLPILTDQPKKPSRKRAKRLNLDYKGLRKAWKLELKQWYSSFEKVNPLYQDCKTDACTVGDIFLGSGTTCFVAQTLGRRSVGIDLSEEYLKIAKRRISSRGMIGRERKPEPDDLFTMP